MKKTLIVYTLMLIPILTYSQDEFQIEETQKKIIRNEISFGLENYSKTNEINGGNYLFGGFHYQIMSRLAIGGKISSDLTPNSFEDLITSIGLRYNSPMEIKKFGRTIGFYYYKNFNTQIENSDLMGIELSLLSYYSDNTYEIDFLPFTILYSIDKKNFSLIYKFIGLKINF
jgi:hypothetical protein